MFVDHSLINRWSIGFPPLLENIFGKHKRPVGGSQRMDETYKLKGVGKYLYRAIDKAMWDNDGPDKVVMDKSGAKNAAINEINAGREIPIVVRQIKYLNNVVEQDHRVIKHVTRPMLNFKSFRSARNVFAGIELMHMIRKAQ